MGLFGGTKRTTKTTNQDNRQIFTDDSDRSVDFDFTDKSDQSRRAEEGSVIAGDGAVINQTGLGLEALTSGFDFAEGVVAQGFDTVDRQAGRTTDLASQVSNDAFNFADDTRSETFDFLGDAFQDSLEISSDSLGQAFANTNAGLVKQQGDFMKFSGVILIGAIAAIGYFKMRAA